MRSPLPSLCLALLLALAGCTTERPEPAEAMGAAVKPVECLILDRIVARRPARPASILFETSDGRTYRNELPGACHDLKHAGAAHIVELEATAGQVCRGDRVRIFDPAEAKNLGRGAFAQCRLGPFTPVSAVRER